jgi:hypothetical protein
MALTILTGSSQAAATNYSYTTNGSSDWTSVPTSSYFYDLVDKIARYKMPNGVIVNTISASYAVSASYAPSTGGSSPIKLTNQTLASGSWVTSSGFYAYTFTNANINTNTRVDFTPDTASYLEVTTCGLQSQVNVSSGTSSFFSLFPPQSNITGEITIFPTV